MTKYKQLLPEPGTSNISQGKNLFENVLNKIQTSPKLSNNTQSTPAGHTQKSPVSQRLQKGSNEDLSR